MSGKRTPLSVRFWTKVLKAGPDDCWIWIGCGKNSKGYGKVWGDGWRHGRLLSAHIASYEMCYGPVPVGLEICHKCDVKLCVNPRHLWAGTHLQNMQDAKRKGRMLKPWLRVPPEVQGAIKIAVGKYQTVAEQFNVSASLVSLIKNGNYPYNKERQTHQQAGRPPKFTFSEVQQIKRAIGKQKEIAALFNTSQMQVSRIQRGLVTLFKQEAA